MIRFWAAEPFSSWLQTKVRWEKGISALHQIYLWISYGTHNYIFSSSQDLFCDNAEALGRRWSCKNIMGACYHAACFFCNNNSRTYIPRPTAPNQFQISTTTDREKERNTNKYLNFPLLPLQNWELHYQCIEENAPSFHPRLLDQNFRQNEKTSWLLR